MIKQHLIFALIFFISFTIYDLIFNETIDWVHNVMVSIFVFLIYSIIEWTKTPYDWNKKSK